VNYDLRHTAEERQVRFALAVEVDPRGVFESLRVAIA
jgi:hypothetical protein